MELKLAAREQITKAQLAKWAKASKSERTVLLDSVCAVTGWHRATMPARAVQQIGDLVG